MRCFEPAATEPAPDDDAVRLRGRRFRLLRQRGRGTPVRGRAEPGAGAGGGRLGSDATGADAGVEPAQRLRRPAPRLALQGGTGPHPQWSARLHATGQGAGGHQLDQCDVLRAGKPGGLRRVGGARMQGLGLRERRPLLPEVGDLRGRRGPLSRRPGAALGLLPAFAPPDIRSIPRGLRQLGNAPARGLQRAARGGGRLRSGHPAPGMASQRLPGVPAAGPRARESRDPHACPRAPGALRRQAGDRRGVHPRRPGRSRCARPGGLS